MAPEEGGFHQFLGYGSYLPNAALTKVFGLRQLVTFRYDVWGDDDNPYWYISNEDLAAANFDKVKCLYG